ncbi:MAG: hypothetical protein HQ509_07355 [Candidatus Marinimicrobia bacterium]|nr:hypothetical protein [Candidatus Neomarinimicrobiota bacterium]
MGTASGRQSASIQATWSAGRQETKEKRVVPEKIQGLIWRSISLLLFILLLNSVSFNQTANKFAEHTDLQKLVFNFTKVEFITEEGQFNDAICTLIIPELKEDSPPYVAIYYKRENSEWFTESLYRKRVRFSFKDGVIKLDRTNFWDWFELEEIKVVILY